VLDVVLALAAVRAVVLLPGLPDGRRHDVGDVLAEAPRAVEVGAELVFLLLGEQEPRALRHVPRSSRRMSFEKPRG